MGACVKADARQAVGFDCGTSMGCGASAGAGAGSILGSAATAGSRSGSSSVADYNSGTGTRNDERINYRCCFRSGSRTGTGYNSQSGPRSSCIAGARASSNSMGVLEVAITLEPPFTGCGLDIVPPGVL